MNSPRVLLIRLSAIGDCVMTLWSATSIRKAFPEAQIDYLIDTRCEDILDTRNLIGNRISLPRQRWKTMPLSANKIVEQWQFYAKLRKMKYDWGIDFHGHSKTAICLRLACPKKRLMARATDEFGRKLNPVMISPEVPLHTVEKNHLALKHFGDFSLPDRPIMPQFESGIGEDSSSRGLVTIAVGAGQSDKTWPIERWEETGRMLLRENYSVCFIGGSDDPIPQVLGSINKVGKLTLAESMKVISQSAIVFCGDTGAGHIAAAYGVPGVSLFGPTDPHVFRPYSCHTQVLQHGKSCLDVTVEQGVEAVILKLKEVQCNSDGFGKRLHTKL